MLKAILFDFDGTIVDSLKHHLYAWKNSYRDMGSDLTDEEIIEKVFYQVEEKAEDKYRITDDHLIHYYRHLAEAYLNLEKHEHIDGLLELLKREGVKLAIISFMDGAHVRESLAKIGLDDYFSVVIGGKDVSTRKPDPQIANIAMDKLGVKPSETMVIGDTNWDILTGKNAGTLTALFVPNVNLPFIDVEYYRATKPDFEIDDYQKFGEFLNTHFLSGDK